MGTDDDQKRCQHCNFIVWTKKKLFVFLKVKVQTYETQTQVIKKENDQLKRDQKKTQIEQQQLELRLNRSLEEIEKLKSQLAKALTSTKDSSETDKKRVEHMQAEIKRLQKQKQELIQAFKKQLKLIDILKKQKMHLEAARMLQFTEEEFINALEWTNANSNSQKPPPPPPPQTSSSKPVSLSNNVSTSSSNRPRNLQQQSKNSASNGSLNKPTMSGSNKTSKGNK